MVTLGFYTYFLNYLNQLQMYTSLLMTPFVNKKESEVRGVEGHAQALNPPGSAVSARARALDAQSSTLLFRPAVCH